MCLLEGVLGRDVLERQECWVARSEVGVAGWDCFQRRTGSYKVGVIVRGGWQRMRKLEEGRIWWSGVV